MGLVHDFRAKLAKLVAPPTISTYPKLGLSASTGSPYEAASTGRRAYGWSPTRLGPSTALWSSLDLMQARCRDSVRNNPWAASAVDTFEAQIIGKGIRPHWNIDDVSVKTQVEDAFRVWAESTACDYSGLLNFYGLQALASREIFEAGEVLARTYVRPKDFGPSAYLQIQLIESEQMPVWRNLLTSNGSENIPVNNSVRVGIEFDIYGRRVAYHLYRENPGETMLFPLAGLQFVRIPATEMLHCYKPRRAGQLRGTPHLASVLGLLLELDQYTDAALVKKKIQAFFTGFVTKTDPDTSVLPNTTDVADTGSGPTPPGTPPPGVENVQLEAGTLQNLMPGEGIVFPNLPAETDMESFMSMSLHKLAVGVGLTHEQLTGDLKGVNLSSIRAGLIDVRRKFEQFQRNIIVQQFCVPLVLAWMKEAVLSGAIRLPGYAQNPAKYTDISWSTPGWPWTEPEKEVGAAVAEVRAGFTTREQIVAGKGDDAALVDTRQAADHDRTEKLGLVYDSNATQTLQRGETRDTETADAGTSAPADANPNAASRKPSLVKSGK